MNKREWLVFGGIVVLTVVVVSRGSHAMQGEAPHYLAVSHSIAHDFDLDLRNQYQQSSGYLFWKSAGDGAYARNGRDGRLYPSNGIGFSVAMVPVLVAAETLAVRVPPSVLESLRWDRGRCARDVISFVLSLLYAWVAILTLRVTRSVCERDTGVTVPVVLAFVTPPMLFMSILAFTEVPAAFLCVWFLTEQMRSRRRPWMTIVPLALLPWLHLRYVIMSAAGIVWVLRDSGRGEGERPAAALALLPVASIALFAAATAWMFGTIVPPPPPDGIWSMVAHWLGGIPGVLFDRDVGLLWVAPFWAIALVGLPGLRRTRPDYVQFALTAFVGTWLLVGLFESPGQFVPPGRVLVPVLPALVPLWSKGFLVLSANHWRWLAYASVAWALWVSAVLIGRPARMWAESGSGIARFPLAEVQKASRVYSAAGRLERMGIGVDEETFIENVRAGNLHVVELFLKAGLAPEPALVAAVQGGRADVLELLLSTGIKPGPDAGRALAWAKSGNETLASMLMSAGADLDSKDAIGETALIAAIRADRADERELLIQHGADVNAATKTGQTALTAAIARADHASVGKLIAAGANVNAGDVDGWTPIIAASRKGDLVSVEALIGAGADVDAMSRLGWTSLMWAAYEGQVELVADLLAAGADVNAKSEAGQTALIRAAERGHLEVVRALIHAGADPGGEVDGADAHAWASRNGHLAVADLLEQAGRSR